MIHQRRASPLHAARAGVGAAWCLTLVAVALSFEHPLLLATLLGVTLAAAAAAHVGRAVVRSLRWAVPFALAIAVVNALVTRDGLTVVFRGGTVPGLGRLDITAEALAYGAVLGLRAMVLIAAGALLAAAVDPDELLRALRSRSLRAGVTAALATHLIPVLARDGRRLADAQRALNGTPPRLAVLRAVTAGALDRATDVAATLEVRGFGSGVRPPRLPRPVSRHDLAFGASAVALVVAGGGRRSGRLGGLRRLPAHRRAGRRPARPARRRTRRLRAGAVPRPPGDRVSTLALEQVTYAYPDAERPSLRDVTLTVEPGEFVVLAGGSGSGKSTLLRAASGLVPHFHGGDFAGRLVCGGLDSSRARPRRAGRRGRHAVPGPRDAGRDGQRALRARVPAREPRLERGRGGARGGGGSARARDRGAARTLDPRALGRRAPARRARRRPGRAARGCCCSTSRPRSSTPWPATSCSASCGGSTRSGGRRCCWPSTGWSAACPPPTA